MNQIYSNFEVIIVNDGSTDDGVEIITKNFSDDRIRIINQENGGVSVARNRGVSESNGEWIAFLDADDEWMPEHLQTLVDASKVHPEADIIGSASYRKDAITGHVSANALIDRYYKRVARINYFMNPDKMTHIGACIVLKNSFIKAGGFAEDIINNEDLLLLGGISMYGVFIYVGLCTHVYVINVAGQTTRDDSKAMIYLSNWVEVLNRFYMMYLDGEKKNSLVPISIRNRWRSIVLGLLKANDYSKLVFAISKISKDLSPLLIENKFITKPSLNKLSICFIYFTMLLWRLHGFPRVGTKSKYNKEQTEKYIVSMAKSL